MECPFNATVVIDPRTGMDSVLLGLTASRTSYRVSAAAERRLQQGPASRFLLYISMAEV